MANEEHNMSYPTANNDTDNYEFLNAWKNGQLVIQKCNHCNKHIFYPRPMCPHCWSTDLNWEQVTGEAEVVSYSLVHRPNHQSFTSEVPIILAEIKLQEGVLMLARILGDNIHSGMKVNLITDSNTTKKYPLPVFKPSIQ